MHAVGVTAGSLGTAKLNPVYQATLRGNAINEDYFAMAEGCPHHYFSC